jgi:hypothetical protein
MVAEAGVVLVVAAGDRRRRRGRTPGTREAQYVPQLVAIREMGQWWRKGCPVLGSKPIGEHRV